MAPSNPLMMLTNMLCLFCGLYHLLPLSDNDAYIFIAVGQSIFFLFYNICFLISCL